MFYKLNGLLLQLAQNVQFRPFNVGASSIGKPTKRSRSQKPNIAAETLRSDARRPKMFDLSVSSPAETPGTLDIRLRRYLRI